MSESQVHTEREPIPTPLMIFTMIEIIGIGLYLPVAAYGFRRLSPEPLLLVFALLIITMPTAFFGMILLHELGHIIAGKLTGLTITSVILGRLTVTITHGAPQVQLARQGSWRRAIVQALPRKATNLRTRMCLFIVDGPTLAILAGIALFIATSVFAAPALQPALWWLALYLCIVMGAAQFLPITFTNYHPGDPQSTHFSDGRALARLWHTNPAAERDVALQVVTHASREGYAAKELPIAWLDRATACPDESLNDILANMLAFSAALARSDEERGRRHLDYLIGEGPPPTTAAISHILKGIPRYLADQRGPFRSNITLQATLNANTEGDSTNARALLARLPESSPSELTALYTQATALTLLAEDQPQAAFTLLDTYLTRADGDDATSYVTMNELVELRRLRDVAQGSSAEIREAQV